VLLTFIYLDSFSVDSLLLTIIIIVVIRRRRGVRTKVTADEANIARYSFARDNYVHSESSNTHQEYPGD
jgi:hypothetical protein